MQTDERPKYSICEKPVCGDVNLHVLLSSPSRRHTLSVHVRAALGYHVHLYSMAPFVFGDEEAVLPHLAQVSRPTIVFSFLSLTSASPSQTSRDVSMPGCADANVVASCATRIAFEPNEAKEKLMFYLPWPMRLAPLTVRHQTGV